MKRLSFHFYLFFILTLAAGGLFVVGGSSCEGAGQVILSGPYCAAEQMTPTASGEVEKLPVESRAFEELLLMAAAAWLLTLLAGASASIEETSPINAERVVGFAAVRLRRNYQPYLFARAP